MWTAIIGVIVTLLGVVVGGGISILKDRVQFRREKDWQRRQLIREKLEEICQVVEDISQNYREIWSSVIIIDVYKVKEIYRTVIPFAKLSMLINFYAPSLKIYLPLLDDLKSLFNNSLTEIIMITDHGESSPKEIFGYLTLIHTEIQKVCKAMTTATSDLASKCI
jgi:hypothetical protein